MEGLSLDVANKNLLEDFSNADADTYVNKDTIEATAKLSEALIANKAAKNALQATTGCKKPFLNIGKKKKAYQKCLDDSAAAKAKAQQDANRTQLELAKAQVEAAKYQAMSTRSAKTNDDAPKFLGMPQTIGIVVTVLGVTAIGVGAVLAIKHFKK